MVFNLILTLLTGAYTNSIIGELVQAGYSVGPLNLDDPPLGDSPMSALLTLEVSFEGHFQSEEESDEESFIEDLQEILKKIGVRYHSIVVVGDEGFAWRGSNIEDNTKPHPLTSILDGEDGI